MDKTIEQIFKAFNHIARELQIYFLSGFLLLMNLGVIDQIFFNRTIWKYTHLQSLFIPTLIIVAYILGHICMAVYCVALEVTGLDKRINALVPTENKDLHDERIRNLNETLPSLPELFVRDRTAYMHFVERYSLLVLMRWNLSAAFLIMAAMDFLCTISPIFRLYSFVAGVASLAACLMFYVLMLYSERDRRTWIRAFAALPVSTGFPNRVKS